MSVVSNSKGKELKNAKITKNLNKGSKLIRKTKNVSTLPGVTRIKESKIRMSEAQSKDLEILFTKLDGPINRNFRRKCCEKLGGLSWTKIYKWIFDQA